MFVVTEEKLKNDGIVLTKTVENVPIITNGIRIANNDANAILVLIFKFLELLFLSLFIAFLTLKNNGNERSLPLIIIR